MRRRDYLTLSGVAVTALAGCAGSTETPVEDDDENGPMAVLEQYWTYFEAGDEEGFRGLFHSESPERDREEWSDEEFWDESFPPEAVEWTSEERELLVQTNDDAVIREEYRWTDADGTTWRVVDRFEFRLEDEAWKIWEIQQELSEEAD